MKLATIAGAAVGSLPGAAPNGEAKPSSLPFDSVLSEVASEGSASPADASSSAGLRPASVSISSPASSDPGKTPSGSNAGVFRQRPDARDQESLTAAAGETLGETKSSLVVSMATTTAEPDVFELATRAAAPIRRAPLGAVLPATAAPIKPAAPETSALSFMASPGAEVVPQSTSIATVASEPSRPVPTGKPGAVIAPQSGNNVFRTTSASGQSAPFVEPTSSDAVIDSDLSGLKGRLAAQASRGAPPVSTEHAEARSAHPVREIGTPDGASPTASAVMGLVAAVIPTGILAPSRSELADASVRGTSVSGAGSLDTGSPASTLPAADSGDDASRSFEASRHFAALPAPAESSTAPAADLGATAAGQPALAAVASVVEQITPGTVKIESHLGFAPGLEAGRLPRTAGATRTGASGVDSKVAASAPGGADAPTLTNHEVAAASLSNDGPTSGALGSTDATDASLPPLISGALRTEARAAEASNLDAADEASPANTAAAKDLLADGDPAPAMTSGRGSPSLASQATEPTVVRAGQPDGPTTIAPNPPTMQLATPAMSPLSQQVADGVAGLAAAAVPDADARGPQVAPARTMTLQLSPAGLGTLSVRLHVAGHALDVRLEASDGRTAALIDRDRDALAGALRSKDYQLQTLSVTTQDATTMPGGTHAERGTDPGSSRSSEPYRDNANRSDQGGRDERGRGDRPQSRPQEEAVVDRVGASLFV